jgi:hypothetical protein
MGNIYRLEEQKKEKESVLTGELHHTYIHTPLHMSMMLSGTVVQD